MLALNVVSMQYIHIAQNFKNTKAYRVKMSPLPVPRHPILLFKSNNCYQFLLSPSRGIECNNEHKYMHIYMIFFHIKDSPRYRSLSSCLSFNDIFRGQFQIHRQVQIFIFNRYILYSILWMYNNLSNQSLMNGNLSYSDVLLVGTVVVFLYICHFFVCKYSSQINIQEWNC